MTKRPYSELAYIATLFVFAAAAFALLMLAPVPDSCQSDWEIYRIVEEK